MDTDHSFIMLILAFVFILLNAFFVLSEFSIVKVRKTRLEELVKDKIPNAKLALDMSNKLDTYLSATQLGITLSSLALGWIGEPAVAWFIEKPMVAIFHMNEVAIHSIAFIVAFTLITLLHVVIGELVPKSIAIAKAEKAALFVSKPLHIFWIIFSPVIKIFDLLSIGILKLIGIKRAKDSDLKHSEEEIKIIASESLKGGVLDSLETEIIKNAVDFSDTVAKEIMTPRKELICLNKQKSFDENYKIILESKFTRFPYIDGNKDNVLGMIHIRDILGQKDIKNFDHIMRKILIVPENSSIAKILPMMNKERLFAAVVIDEYGGTAGFITMEDIVEEIFGDINDEHDENQPIYKKLGENIFEFRGRSEIEVVEDIMNISFDDETEQMTIGGYVFNLLGCLPIVGDKIEDENCIYEVLKMDGRSIYSLKVIKKEVHVTSKDKIDE